MTDSAHSREVGGDGITPGLAAYLMWGVMPLYFGLLRPAGPWEILGHRILWSLVVCVILLRILGRPLPSLRRPAVELLALATASVLIAVNWVTYLTAVATGRVTEAALGYFLNPLVSIALGLVLLGERLRRPQAVAVAIGAAAALFLVVTDGHIPWIAFALAISFGLYGLAKKRAAPTLGALPGLTVETALLAPAAAVLLTWLSATGQATFSPVGGSGWVHAALLASAGVVTAVPLLLFAMAAQRLPLATLGLLQFVSPVLQLVTGLALGEHVSTARWIGFAAVWVALVVLVADGMRHRPRTDRRATGGAQG